MVVAGNAGLRMNPEAEDGTEKNSVTGEDARQKFYGEEAYAEKRNELKEKLKEMNSYSGVKRLSYIQSPRDALSTVRDRCMQYLFSIFFGEFRRWDFGVAMASAQAGGVMGGNVTTQAVTYHDETYMEEKEETSFSTKGIVKTEDGRTISFDLNVQMSRSFQAYYEENFTRIEQRMTDPLVINLEGNIAELRDQTFFFDLDADGVKEEISMLGSGSGYLALDKNGDGVIKPDDDRFIVGNDFPRYTFGFTYGLEYKGFDFSMMWQGVGKRNKWMRGESVEAFHNNNEGPVMDFHQDRWTPNNPDATYPRLTMGAESANNAAKSDFWIQDAKYLRRLDILSRNNG